MKDYMHSIGLEKIWPVNCIQIMLFFAADNIKSAISFAINIVSSNQLHLQKKKLLNSSYMCMILFDNLLYVLSFVFCPLDDVLFERWRRFELRGLLVLWNSALALFSIMGAMRTAPELIHVLLKFGLFHSVCNQRLVFIL